MSDWYQITVSDPRQSADETFPSRVFSEFLPLFVTDDKGQYFILNWHFLFEPDCLIRFRTTNPSSVIEIARRIADSNGFLVTLGDTSPFSDPQNRELAYTVETKNYGVNTFLNLRFLETCSRLSLAGMDLSKHVHLLCNSFGLDYRAEADFYLKRAARCLELAEQYEPKEKDSK